MKYVIRETPRSESEKGCKDSMEAELFEDGYVALYQTVKSGDVLVSTMMLFNEDEVSRLKAALREIPYHD